MKSQHALLLWASDVRSRLLFTKENDRVGQIEMEELDLRGVICPYNFVKTKLKLDTLEIGSQLVVLLDDGDPIQNVPKSIKNEGHQVLTQEKVGGYYRIVIQKEDL